MENREPKLCPYMSKSCIQEECTIWTDKYQKCSVKAHAELLGKLSKHLKKMANE